MTEEAGFEPHVEEKEHMAGRNYLEVMRSIPDWHLMSNWPQRAEALKVGDYMPMAASLFASWGGFGTISGDARTLENEKTINVSIVKIIKDSTKSGAYAIKSLIVEGAGVTKEIDPSLFYNQGIEHYN